MASHCETDKQDLESVVVGGIPISKDPYVKKRDHQLADTFSWQQRKQSNGHKCRLEITSISHTTVGH